MFNINYSVLIVLSLCKYLLGGYWNTSQEVYDFVDMIAEGRSMSEEEREAGYDFFVNNEIAGLHGIAGIGGTGTEAGFLGFMRLESEARYYYQSSTFKSGYHVKSNSHTYDFVMNFTDTLSESGTQLTEYALNATKPFSCIEPESNYIVMYGKFSPEDANQYIELIILKADTTATDYISGQTEPVPLTLNGSAVMIDASGFTLHMSIGFDTNLVAGMV